MGRRSRLNAALDLALQSDAHGPISRPVLARPSVSNAVALADILRCPVVVADQAAGQKDVEADLWVRVSAVWMRHSGRAGDQRTVMSAGTMAAARGVRAEHSDRARDQRTVVSAGTTAAARGVRAGVGMPEMQTATFPAAALSDWLRASASSFRWSQTLAVSLCLSHCLSVRSICDRQCYAAGPDCPILVPSEALRGSDCLAGRRQLQDL